MSSVTYNERSWAIDIISEITLFASNTNKPIKRAGGENTINTGRRRLFPDVLLYGENSDILMGWELKMPDTSISDSEFIDNAALKAEILKLNGFLLWNAQEAILYTLDEDRNKYEPIKSWDTSHNGAISSRQDVLGNRPSWIESLKIILQDLNTFFDSGTIKRKPLIESFKDSSIIDFILKSSEANAISLKSAARTDTRFRAEANVWWRVSKHEYPLHDQWEILSEIILVNWINKILFTHILTAFYNDAEAIYDIDHSTSPTDASAIFEQISSTCDFWNIFQPQLGETYITAETWDEIIQLNFLLKDIELASIGQELLQSLLESVIYASKRKVAGQYTTPMNLARFLVHFTVNDLTQTFHDPCCGTGTISRAIYDIKKEAGLSATNSLSTIYASDKVAFPLQMATLAIAEPANMGSIIQIFKQDCTEIVANQEIEFKDPFDGSTVSQEYERVDSIASNLPFIQQEDLKVLNPDIKERTNNLIQERAGANIKLNAKSDLYAYLPFFLWDLLAENGRLGIIISNSWLGTEWGEKFREALLRFYSLEYVIAAGRGRWFHNADIVTNILILQKKSNPVEPTEIEETSFITINKKIEDIENNSEIEELYENVITNTIDDNIMVQTYNTRSIMTIPLNWNTLFSDISWLHEIENILIYCSDLFVINRGERRGWNQMFYPKNDHGIESNYIKPVLKTSRHISTLVTRAETDAFCCSKTKNELRTLGHTGALSWIERFEHAYNTTGEPLIDVLSAVASEGEHWYEMSDSRMADMVASLNFDQRIFIAKFDTPSFVDQRLTRFTAINNSIDVDLSHALLNSLLGVFFIESLGFGRGLGALDLSSTRMKKYLRMLDPNLLTPEQIIDIKEKFISIKNREIKSIIDELNEVDRNEFNDTVLDAFGISHLKDKIITSFLYLYNMRVSVNL